jgi:hypothetical protein
MALAIPEALVFVVNEPRTAVFVTPPEAYPKPSNSCVSQEPLGPEPEGGSTKFASEVQAEAVPPLLPQKQLLMPVLALLPHVVPEDGRMQDRVLRHAAVKVVPAAAPVVIVPLRSPHSLPPKPPPSMQPVETRQE